jgi:hypothetical protein
MSSDIEMRERKSERVRDRKREKERDKEILERENVEIDRERD